MSTRRRTDSVVRIRALQERVAEAEAGARRRNVEAHRNALDGAYRDLAERDAHGAEMSSVSSLVGHRTAIDNAVVDIGRRHERLDHASGVFKTAEAAWHVAHQRHEAVERLDTRLREADAEETARLAQLELDDLVVVRHGRNAAIDKEQR
ncbi:MAG: flagellar FliJ family protein [Ilumatobacter sp.]